MSPSHFSKIRFNNILPSTYRSYWLFFPSGFPIKILYAFPCMPCPSHAPCIDHSTNTMGWWVQIMSPLLYSFQQLPLISFRSAPNMLFSILFRNTLSLCSSLNLCCLASHTNRTTGKISFVYFNLMFIDSSGENKRFGTEWQTESPEINLLLNSLWIKF
jgi:hypothetical protein